jgi:hypothetical protein
MIVDVTLTRDKKILANFTAHQAAVATLVDGLRAHRNWYLDLANERDVRDARFVSIEELKRLRDQIRLADKERLVTASFGGHDLDANDVRELLTKVAWTSLLHIVHATRSRPPKPPRTPSGASTCMDCPRAPLRPCTTRNRFAAATPSGNRQPSDFLEDLRGAMESGAAGWCFHNGAQRGTPGEQPRRSFDLSTLRLFDQLDSEERAFLDRLDEVVERKQ